MDLACNRMRRLKEKFGGGYQKWVWDIYIWDTFWYSSANVRWAIGYTSLKFRSKARPEGINLGVNQHMGNIESHETGWDEQVVCMCVLIWRKSVSGLGSGSLQHFELREMGRNQRSVVLRRPSQRSRRKTRWGCCVLLTKGGNISRNREERMNRVI